MQLIYNVDAFYALFRDNSLDYPVKNARVEARKNVLAFTRVPRLIMPISALTYFPSARSYCTEKTDDGGC